MNRAFTAELRQQLIDTYRPLIDPSRPVALVDFPVAVNSGDHAIWLGEKALLRHLGIAPAYECALETYDFEAMADALKDGTILMHGGGNFGDIYKYHRFRLRLLSDFPGNKVIVFPQSMMFYSTQSLKRTAEQFERHGNATITARDALSHYKMGKYFGPKTKVLLAPDMAFMMNPLKRIRKPKFDILWLRRDDRESALTLPLDEIAKLGPMTPTVLKMVPADGRAVLSEALFVGETLCVTDWYRATLQNDEPELDTLDFDARSIFWVTWALSILSLGRIVVTDRLHGHILSLLAGFPHILLNNNYGKNFTYYDTWSKDMQGSWIVPNPKSALENALNIVKTIKDSDAA